MRVVQNNQMHIGEIDVSHIVIDAKSRDAIPQILRGLPHLYQDRAMGAKLFELLARTFRATPVKSASVI